MTPLHDRVIVQPAAAEEKTAGGIIIPDTAKEKPQSGTVVAVGPGKYADKPELIPVKKSWRSRFCMANMVEPKFILMVQDYLIMRTSDILMKVPSIIQLYKSATQQLLNSSM